jgi:Uma2 family endonuclease
VFSKDSLGVLSKSPEIYSTKPWSVTVSLKGDSFTIKPSDWREPMVSSVSDRSIGDEPFSNEPELENSLHLAQIILLVTCLEWWWQQRQDFFAAGNLSIFYQPEPFQSNKFKGPDFFVVTGTDRRPRKSWMVSLEGGKFPNVIVEILSPKTAKTDRTLKKDLYQNLFKTPEYFWFNPTPSKLDNTFEFKGFRLQAGVYQEIVPNSQDWLWSEELDLHLGIFNGMVRYFTADGVMVPNFEEETARQANAIAAIQRRLELEQRRLELEQRRADYERQRAESEHQRAEDERKRAESERQRADQLAEHLRAIGIDPDSLFPGENASGDRS